MPSREQKADTKDNVLPILISYFGVFGYQRRGDIDLEPFLKWHVLPPFTKSRFSDLVSGSLAGVPVSLQPETNTKRTTTDVQIER